MGVADALEIAKWPIRTGHDTVKAETCAIDHQRRQRPPAVERNRRDVESQLYGQFRRRRTLCFEHDAAGN